MAFVYHFVRIMGARLLIIELHMLAFPPKTKSMDGIVCACRIVAVVVCTIVTSCHLLLIFVGKCVIRYYEFTSKQLKMRAILSSSITLSLSRARVCTILYTLHHNNTLQTVHMVFAVSLSMRCGTQRNESFVL